MERSCFDENMKIQNAYSVSRCPSDYRQNFHCGCESVPRCTVYRFCGQIECCDDHRFLRDSHVGDLYKRGHSYFGSPCDCK